MLKFLVLFLLSFNAFAFNADCSLYFSPKGGVTVAIVNLINSATKSIEVQSYKLTSKPIADALIAASKRGIHVVAVIDKTQPAGKGSQLDKVKLAGIEVFIDSEHAIQHNKVIIVDGTRFQTGSFNLSQAAEISNAENAMICTSQVGSDLFKADFNKHLKHSTRF